MLKLSCKSLAFTSNKALLKYKIRSEISLPVSFSAQLLKKKNITVVTISIVYCNGLITTLQETYKEAILF